MKKQQYTNSQRGDTIVEVLLAMVIMSAIMIGAVRMMSLGTSIAIDDVISTKVQGNSTTQISILRYARDEYARSLKQPSLSEGAKDWQAIMSYVKTTPISSSSCPSSQTDNSYYRSPFWISTTRLGHGNAANDTTINDYTYAGTITSDTPEAGHGIWVEAYRPAGANYVDFVVKACWYSLTGGQDYAQNKTAVRLYVP